MALQNTIHNFNVPNRDISDKRSGSQAQKREIHEKNSSLAQIEGIVGICGGERRETAESLAGKDEGNSLHQSRQPVTMHNKDQILKDQYSQYVEDHDRKYSLIESLAFSAYRRNADPQQK